MIFTMVLKSISVMLIVGMVIVLYSIFKRSKPISFLISLLLLLIFIFTRIREALMDKMDWDFFLSFLLLFINIVSSLVLIVFTIYIFIFSIFNFVKKKINYHCFLLTIFNITLCYILLFNNVVTQFHESNYVMGKRTQVVQQLLKSDEIKNIVIGKNDTYDRFFNYKLPKEDRWLSEYGEVSIKNNYIEFYYSQGTEITTTDSYVYSFDGNKPNSDEFSDLEETRKVSEHWYYVSYGRY